MDIRLIIQSTPNPNALKFVVNTPVKTHGNFTYTSMSQCDQNPLAKAIFEQSPAIKEVYFFDNYITVTQSGLADWRELEEKLRMCIQNLVPSHDPNFTPPEVKAASPFVPASSPEMDQINAILDQTVRPSLQMDGGDVQVVSYANKEVEIYYQGACGSCPSAAMGTLAAIENILRNQFDPEIRVTLADIF